MLMALNARRVKSPDCSVRQSGTGNGFRNGKDQIRAEAEEPEPDLCSSRTH